MSKDKAPFQFRKFSVYHDRAVKVGTDAVLIGAWSDPGRAINILDVGTGSGVISLMLAQKSLPEATIEAIEIDQESFGQASGNFDRSPWSEKIRIYHQALQDFCPERKYDLIVTNPPYFRKSLMPVSLRRSQARHDPTLSFDELIAGVKRLLSDSGRFAVILPTREGHDFHLQAEGSGLYCSRRCAFYSRKNKPQERWLMEFWPSPVSMVEETLVLYDQGNTWSAGYRELTRAFYLQK